ncbi:MAG: histidine phosphatase family protein [Patescibacteria group bacterium]
MKFIIARHGETIEGHNGILLGHLPGRLSPLGFEQATRLALRLKDEPIRIIATSDLARARDTAQAVAKFHPDAVFEVTEALRERGLGILEGKPKAETPWADRALQRERPEQGESLDDLYARAEKVIAEFIKTVTDRTVVAMGHADINLAIVAALTGKPATEILTMETPRNTAVSIFELTLGLPVKVIALNDASHLA